MAIIRVAVRAFETCDSRARVVLRWFMEAHLTSVQELQFASPDTNSSIASVSSPQEAHIAFTTGSSMLRLADFRESVWIANS